MPKKSKMMRSKKESRVGQASWKKGSRGAYRAPNNLSVKTTRSNKLSVANEIGVNTKIGLSDDILRPLPKFAQDLKKKLNSVSNVPAGLEKMFIVPCDGRTCFDSTNLNKFPGLNKANTRVNNGSNPADQARLCQYLNKLSQDVVYKNAKFMAKRSNLMLTSMKKYFDKKSPSVRRMSSRSARSSARRSARSSARRSARLSTRRSAKSTSSGPPSNSPPSPPFSNKSSSTSSHLSRGINLSEFNQPSDNFALNPLVGECNVESKVKEIQKALNECSNVKIKQNVLAKLMNQN